MTQQAAAVTKAQVVELFQIERSGRLVEWFRLSFGAQGALAPEVVADARDGAELLAFVELELTQEVFGR